MIRRTTYISLLTSWLVVPLFLSQRLMAAGEFTDSRLTLTAYLLVRPVVHSFSESILYSGTGARIYNQQLILGHQVADETSGTLRFNGQFVSPIGYANITTGDMDGYVDHCYSAQMASHVNAFSLHQFLYVFDKCIPEPPPKPEPPDENCPILLDLKLNGFHLSGPDPAVSFDINADGTLDDIAWTKAGEDDAFLCLDRNHNGIIDDGAELFGYATPLLSGEPAKIGYRALAELDDASLGGNGDGRVDARDRMFRDLCAWVDRNRDGISQPNEIYTLDQVGVVALEFRYTTIHVEDSYGNLFRYTSRVEMRGPAGSVLSWPTYDVIFAAQ
ncbi:MAG: hypothetical protein WAM82_33670 [Thermoanaerobaculia bacterium]